MNNFNQGYVIPPKGFEVNKAFQAAIFFLASEISRILNSKKACEMKGFCKSNNDGIDPTNNLCETAPLNKLNESSACPIVQLE